MWKIFNWFSSVLENLGLRNKKAKIVFLGLDDAGKTTLLLKLKENVIKQMDPTQQPYCEQLTLGAITFKAWDIGGHQAARKTWRNYTSDVDGIVYLIDSSNPKRFEESQIQLKGLMDIQELQKVPILILGNKIDKKGAVPEDQIRQGLGINDILMQWSDKNQKSNERPIKLFMCSITSGIGYGQGFKWLSKFLQQK